MKIRDLNKGDYVIVYDLGKSIDHNGMTVVGKVIDYFEFIDEKNNQVYINSNGNKYLITDDNEFELWTKSIEDKTESINTIVKWNDNGNLEVKDNYEIKVPNDILDNNSDVVGYIKDEINTHRSNDVQQRKRNVKEIDGFKTYVGKVRYNDGKPINDTVNHPSHYNCGDIEVIDFIEQVTQHYNPNVAYHIGNAIKYLARSPHKNGKEDVAKAKWYIERAFDKWDVK